MNWLSIPEVCKGRTQVLGLKALPTGLTPAAFRSLHDTKHRCQIFNLAGRQIRRDFKGFGAGETAKPNVEGEANQRVLAHIQMPRSHPLGGLAVFEVQLGLILSKKELPENGVTAKQMGDQIDTITS